MAVLGQSYLKLHRYTEAEALLRECLAVPEEIKDEAWVRSVTRSQLGGAMLGRKQYSEAEPLLLSGYEGMRTEEARIPASRKSELREAAERVVQLYEAWGKPEKAAEWRAKLGLIDLPADVFDWP
jgi:hypothetical protein